MKKGVLQKIFLDHYTYYEVEHGVSRDQDYAAQNIMTCRTWEKGYHVDECPDGCYRCISPNS